MVKKELTEKVLKLLPLVEKRYALTDTLPKEGLECFKVSDNIVRFFCENTKNYEADKEFIIEWKKLKVSQGSYRKQYFLDLQIEAGELADKYNKPWLLALTHSSKAIMKCYYLKTPQCQNVMASFYSEFNKAWSREVKRFSTQRFINHNPSVSHDMISLIDEVCSQCLGPLGFKQYKKHVNTNKKLYLKHLHDDWHIYIVYDVSNIKKGVSHTESFFGIAKIEKSTTNLFASNTIRSTFEHNDFICLNDADLGHYLKDFSSPQELEAIIRINTFLYQLIVNHGFEKALV